MAESESHLVINDELAVPLSELQMHYVRSSGPGGQNVNKVSSQVQLSWDLGACESLPADVLERLRTSERGRITKAGVLRLDCQRFRDREKNRRDCLDRLREMIVQNLKPPKKRRKTRVPRRVVEKRLQAKQQRSEVKRTRRRPRLDD